MSREKCNTCPYKDYVKQVCNEEKPFKRFFGLGSLCVKLWKENRQMKHDRGGY